MADRRYIALFKAFVERVFLPNFKPTDRPVIQWSRFSNLLTQQTIGIEQLQLHLENLNISVPQTIQKRQMPLFKRPSRDQNLQNNTEAFNPNKTFGGERNRLMFMKNQSADQQKPQFSGYGNFSKEAPTKTTTFNQSANLLPGLQRLCRIFIDNQIKLQNVLIGSNPPGKGF